MRANKELYDAAIAELRLRAAKINLACFILETLPNYKMGWVHEEICNELDSFLEQVIAKKSPRLIITMPPRHGKLCADDTPVLTTAGWKNHGELRVGDYVYHPSGKAVKVVAVGQKDYATHAITFSNGDTIAAHLDHEWLIYDKLNHAYKTVDTRYINFAYILEVCNSFYLDTPHPAPQFLPFLDTTLKHIVVTKVQKLKKPKLGNCIQVDSPDGLYLVGKHLTITHNSEIASRRFPAYALGRYPDLSFIATSYSADLASRMNRDVQRIIDSQEYKRIFPNTTLGGSSRSQGSYLRNSDIFEIVDHKGTYRSAGVGGGITGMGAECVSEDSYILTTRGWRFAKDLRVGDLVFSYNHSWDSLEVDVIDAVRARMSSSWYKFDSLEVTDNHPIYTLRGYIQAKNIISEDAFLHPDGSFIKVSECQHINGKPRRFIDFQVRKNHNFFADDVLVHNCILIDDPIKDRAEADSATIRNKVWDWYTSTLYTRLAPGGGLIVIQTRWHMDDLTGRLLNPNSENWRVVNFPAIAEHDEKYRKVGEALHPERYDLAALNRIKKAVGSRDWAALYQQRPVPAEGAVFKQEWIKYYTQASLPPVFNTVLISWDMTFKDSAASDFVVGQVWGKNGANFYLLDSVRGRWDFVKTLEMFQVLANKWPKALKKLVEDKANGTAIIQTLKKSISGIKAITPKDSKEARAYSITPLWEAGNVFIPDPKTAAWVKDFEAEILSFPSAAHDDQVDAMTQALAELKTSTLKIHPTNLQYLRLR